MTTAQPGIPVENSTARIVGPHRPCHAVATEIVGSRATDVMNEIFGPETEWFVFLIFDDGSVGMFGRRPWTPAPTPEVSHMMIDIGRRLNQELSGPGYWMIGWHPQQRMSMIFCDRDGTPKFTQDVDDAWQRVRRLTIEQFLDRAAEAAAQYVQMRQGLGVPLKLDTLRPADLTERAWFSRPAMRN